MLELALTFTVLYRRRDDVYQANACSLSDSSRSKCQEVGVHPASHPKHRFPPSSCFKEASCSRHLAPTPAQEAQRRHTCATERDTLCRRSIRLGHPHHRGPQWRRDYLDHSLHSDYCFISSACVGALQARRAGRYWHWHLPHHRARIDCFRLLYVLPHPSCWQDQA